MRLCGYHVCERTFEMTNRPGRRYCSLRCQQAAKWWRYTHRKPGKRRAIAQRSRKRRQRKATKNWYASVRHRASLKGLLETVDRIHKKQRRTAGNLNLPE